MAAMLEEQNNKSYLHKNKTFFPMERNSIVFLLQHGRCEQTSLTWTITLVPYRTIFLESFVTV